jgi:EmrB/QacA subfamily drug resistance transporter
MTTTARTGPAGPADQAGGSRLRWLAAAVLIIGTLMDMIDVTIVNVALPTIRAELHASATQLEWAVSGYMLAFAAALIVAGSFGDLLGRKRMYLAGAGVFGAASLGAGLATSPAQLIACRVVQGLAAAAMAPQVLATFRVMFDAKERSKAFSIYGATLGFASAVGLLAGGLLTEANLFGWSWRAVFFVNVPVAVVTLIAGAWLIPETRERDARRPDLLGAAGLAASLVAIVYPLLEGRQLGWPAWIWAVLAAGLAGLVLLGVAEQRRRRPQVAPLLRPGLLRIPAFSAGLGVQMAFAAGLQAFFLAFALWLQAGQHFSPLRAGLTSIAFSAGSFVLAPVAVPLAQKYGRSVLVLGGIIMAAGTVVATVGAHHIGVGGSSWPVVPGLLIMGAGLSLLVIPLVNVVLAAVPAEAAGGASGQFSTAQQLGGAIGVAIGGTVFFGYLGSGHTFVAAFSRTAPYVIGAFLLCALASLLLPRTAVADEFTAEAATVGDGEQPALASRATGTS